MTVVCMQALSKRHRYPTGLLRYVRLCGAWRPTVLDLGEQPHAPGLLPDLPAAFAYNDELVMPESIQRLLSLVNAPDRAKVRLMFRLPYGVALHFSTLAFSSLTLGAPSVQSAEGSKWCI